MKYYVGDLVRIKDTDIEGTIESIIRGQFIVNTKGSKIPVWPEAIVLMKSVEEETTSDKVIEEAKTYWDSIKDAWICPDGYIFKDENGNVINATKIVLEKKKKEYPKTYEECCEVLDFCGDYFLSTYDADSIVKKEVYGILQQINALTRLLICRSAYWKIAGEEMGLGKPWEPTKDEMVYSIYRHSNKIGTEMFLGKSVTFEFPTPEMRDAFYENFKEEIELCKELL